MTHLGVMAKVGACDGIVARNNTEERGDEIQQKGTKLTVFSVIPSNV